MSRGLTDEPVQPNPNESQDDELTNIINELIKGQNKLHDRLVDLERALDHMKEMNELSGKPNSRSQAKRLNILGL